MTEWVNPKHAKLHEITKEIDMAQVNCPGGCMGGKIMMYDEKGNVIWITCQRCGGSGTIDDGS